MIKNIKIDAEGKLQVQWVGSDEWVDVKKDKPKPKKKVPKKKIS